MTSSQFDQSFVLSGAAPAVSAFARLYGVRALATGDGARESFVETRALHSDRSINVDISRRTLVLRKGKTKIVASLDHVVGDAGEAQPMRFAEIKLEMKKGSPETFVDVARLCLEESGGALRPVSNDPAVRAARYLDPAHLLAPANKISVAPSQTADEVYRDGVSFCAERALAIAPLVDGASGAGEPLRQMRVLLRRLRTYERIFRQASADREMKALSRRARAFARLFGEARDWDVFVTQTLPSIEASVTTLDGMADLMASARQHQLASAERIAAVASGADFSLFLFDLAAVSRFSAADEGQARDEPIASFARTALEGRLAIARSVGKDLALKDLNAGHPLRLALKKLRYSAQLFRDLYDREKRKPYFQALSRLQEGFGALNDAAVAQELATRAASGEGKAAMRAAGFVSGYRTAEAQAASARLLDDWNAFSTMTPYWT